jgi:hypothetical protein
VGALLGKQAAFGVSAGALAAVAGCALAALPSGSGGAGQEDAVRGTLLALAVLAKSFGGERGVWVLVARRSVAWLGSVGVADVPAAVAAVQQML